ncbi:MAG: sugar phosphate isomerase/epimerase [Thermoprotei archaeon]|nr:MAG: sugar phosphate isomerase/epimerase [Thermoprotei archaeon]
MKFSICNELFKDMSFREICSIISEIGYHGIEIAPFTLCEDVRQLDMDNRIELRDTAEQYGVSIVGLHWLLVTPPGLHILSRDIKVREFTKEYLIELVKLNHDIGGKVLVFGSPKQRNIPEGVPRKRAFELAVKLFRDVAKVAEDLGCIIAFEPLAKHLTNFVNTVEEGLSLVEAVDSPSFRLILDVYSMSDENKPYSEIIRRAGRYLSHFHANDTNGLGPGMGNADYNEIASALREIGYRGYLSVEILKSVEDPLDIARRSYNFLRKIFR